MGMIRKEKSFPSQLQTRKNVTFQVGLDQALTPSWYVIHTLPNREFKVETGLLRKGLEIFLPRITVPSRRTDRKKLIEVPLFRSYLFVHTSLWPREFYDIIMTPGVFRILGPKGHFVPVPTEVIESLKIVTASASTYYPCDNLPLKARVRVLEGPLEGAIGVIQRRREKKRRMIISLDLMNLAVAVELGNESVEPYP
jgi:transcriptional antiterminator NusG